MRQFALRTVLALLVSLFLVLPAQARKGSKSSRSDGPNPPTATEQEVLRDFELILDLWREGRYAELYERTTGGRDGKENFAKRLAAAPRKPACCWEKLQQAQVSLKGERDAVVRAKLGFEGNVSGTEFVTKGIKLKRDDGNWQISQSELFSLAQLTKKRDRYRYLPIQPK